MGRRLAAYTSVDGVWYGPDSDVPDDVASRITNPKAWADAAADPVTDEPDPAPGDDGEASAPPPKGGPGSGRDAWVEYAESLGVVVDEDATRDEIIDAVADAGHPVD